MKWPFFRTNWRPHVLRAVGEFTSVACEQTVDEIHTTLRHSGLSEDNATKLVLFIPTAFARERYEAEGIAFPDTYLRTDPDRPPCRIPYHREPIFQTAREVARGLIHAKRFYEVDVVILWSAEGRLIKESIARGTRLVRITEITHHF